MLRHRYLEYLGFASLLLTGCMYPPVQDTADMQPQQPLLADLAYQYNQANAAANPPSVVVIAQPAIEQTAIETAVTAAEDIPLDPPANDFTDVDDSVAFADNLPIEQNIEDVPPDPPVNNLDNSIAFTDNIPPDPPADLAIEPFEDNAPLTVNIDSENSRMPVDITPIVAEEVEVEVVFLNLEDMSIRKQDAPADKKMQFVKTVKKSFSSPSEAEKTDTCSNLSSAERKELESLRSMVERLM